MCVCVCVCEGLEYACLYVYVCVCEHARHEVQRVSKSRTLRPRIPVDGGPRAKQQGHCSAAPGHHRSVEGGSASTVGHVCKHARGNNGEALDEGMGGSHVEPQGLLHFAQQEKGEGTRRPTAAGTRVFGRTNKDAPLGQKPLNGQDVSASRSSEQGARRYCLGSRRWSHASVTVARRTISRELHELRALPHAHINRPVSRVMVVAEPRALPRDIGAAKPITAWPRKRASPVPFIGDKAALVPAPVDKGTPTYTHADEKDVVASRPSENGGTGANVVTSRRTRQAIRRDPRRGAHRGRRRRRIAHHRAR